MGSTRLHGALLGAVRVVLLQCIAMGVTAASLVGLLWGLYVYPSPAYPGTRSLVLFALAALFSASAAVYGVLTTSLAAGPSAGKRTTVKTLLHALTCVAGLLCFALGIASWVDGAEAVTGALIALIALLLGGELLTPARESGPTLGPSQPDAVLYGAPSSSDAGESSPGSQDEP